MKPERIRVIFIVLCIILLVICLIALPGMCSTKETSRTSRQKREQPDTRRHHRDSNEKTPKKERGKDSDGYGNATSSDDKTMARPATGGDDDIVADIEDEETLIVSGDEDDEESLSFDGEAPPTDYSGGSGEEPSTPSSGSLNNNTAASNPGMSEDYTSSTQQAESSADGNDPERGAGRSVAQRKDKSRQSHASGNYNNTPSGSANHTCAPSDYASLAVVLIVTLLIVYIVARIMAKNGRLVITANGFDKCLIIGSALVFFIVWCIGFDHGLTDLQIMLLIVSGLMLVGSLLFSVFANIPNLLNIIISVLAKLFIWVGTLFLLLLFIVILVFSIMRTIMSHGDREGTYLVKYDHLMNRWVGYRVE